MDTNEMSMQESTDTKDTAVDTSTQTAQQAEPESEPSTDIAEIQRELAAARKAKDIAEKALTLEKSAHSKLKREHMTEAELIAEERAAVAEKAKMYDRQTNAMIAEKIFVGAGLQSDTYEDLLNLIVSEDSQRTESTAQTIVDLLSMHTKSTIKAEREKILRETPYPPAGDKDTVDPFLEGFNKPY